VREEDLKMIQSTQGKLLWSVNEIVHEVCIPQTLKNVVRDLFLSNPKRNVNLLIEGN